MAISLCRGGDDRPGADELPRPRIDAQVEPFERAGAEEAEITRLGEDDIVGGRAALDVHDREADVSLADLAISEHESVASLDGHAEILEDAARKTRELTPRVDEDVIQWTQQPAARGMLDAERDSEGSHVAQCITAD
jgi:hypothetical protein